MTFPPDVLIYCKAKASRATVHRHYKRRRKEQGTHSVKGLLFHISGSE